MLTYSKSGVDYKLLDPAKRLGQIAGLKTINNVCDTGFRELSKSRGETAYILESKDCYYAFVEEGLGTKNLVADEMSKITGKTYYDAIAMDTVAAIVNDLTAVGARPLTVLAYWGVGYSEWFSDKDRLKDLVNGWKKACDQAGATWGGGETPSMSDVIKEGVINLAGASFGIIKPKKRLIIGDKLKAGDRIIILQSNGIHANGLSLARKIVKYIPGGYKARLDTGNMFGEELLKPTIIYSKFVDKLLNNNVDIHYMVNITGHGWRKLMRATQQFTYIVDTAPKIPELFTFIQKYSQLTLKEMYETFNMGGGFALISPQSEIRNIITLANKFKIKAYDAGYIKKGEKKVIINPYKIILEGKSLEVKMKV